MRKCAVCSERAVMAGQSSKAIRAQFLDLCNACMDVKQVRVDRAGVVEVGVAKGRAPAAGGDGRAAKAAVSGVGKERSDRKLALVIEIVTMLEKDSRTAELLTTWSELRALIRDGLA